MCLAQGPQRSEAGEALGLESSTLLLNHCPPSKLKYQLFKIIPILMHYETSDIAIKYVMISLGSSFEQTWLGPHPYATLKGQRSLAFWFWRF